MGKRRRKYFQDGMTGSRLASAPVTCHRPFHAVREKKHCGRRLEFAISAFMPEAAVSSQTAHQAHRIALHTIAPPRSQPWERMRPRLPGMAVGLRNASRLLRSGLQSRDVCASRDRATASVSVRRSGVTNMCAGRHEGVWDRFAKTVIKRCCVVRAGFNTSLRQA